MDPLLEPAARAARLAQKAIRAVAGQPGAMQVRSKQVNDFVTQADLTSQRIISETLLSSFPHHAVLGEESAELLGSSGADHVWIVDPLDGTNNFVHGYPVGCISIALSVRGRVEHGLILDLYRDELFHAGLGAGAWCGDRRLAVGDRSVLQDALVASNGPFRAGADFDRQLQRLGAVMRRSSALRRSGSAALDLAWVAAGYCDACFDVGLRAWDVAAGMLLVREAGGRVGTFAGDPDCLEAQECLAANPMLFTALGALLRPFSGIGSSTDAVRSSGDT